MLAKLGSIVSLPSVATGVVGAGIETSPSRDGEPSKKYSLSAQAVLFPEKMGVICTSVYADRDEFDEDAVDNESECSLADPQ
jgi:hypothetical protein